jgi:hypothetical protein
MIETLGKGKARDACCTERLFWKGGRRGRGNVTRRERSFNYVYYSFFLEIKGVKCPVTAGEIG